MISNKTLGKFATYGVVICISTVMYVRYKIQERIKNTEYYREAFKILRGHEGAIHLLGQPIKDTGFDLGDEKNICDANKAQLEINVKGPKDKGVMFFWAENNKDNWIINRIELELPTHPDKRLLIKNINAEKKEKEQTVK